MTRQLDNKLPEHPFWRFSLQLYDFEAVEKSLLFLQQRYGINVNIILYFCWVGANGQGRFSQGKVKTILEIISNWHSRVVLPLRRMRQQLKNHCESAKEIIFEEELSAEQAEQLMLADAFWFISRTIKSPPQKVADISRSIVAYCTVMEVKIDEQFRRAMVEVLQLMYPMLLEGEIQTITEQVLQPQPRMAGSVGTQLSLDV